MRKNIYISFIEEAIMNPDYQNYIAGRIEVTRPGDHYHSEEIRFLTNDTDRFYHFKNEWDMRIITEDELEVLRRIISSSYKCNLI